jgi:hypothetical protein
MLTFEECKNKNYPARTIINSKSSDVTLAIACNFNTRGEILTKKVSKGKYIAMILDFKLTQERIEKLASKLNLIGKDFILNIAGNGIYTIYQTQQEVDKFLYSLISGVIPLLSHKIVLGRCGGQSGVDEAGAKACVRCGIDALVLAPNGWVWRNRNNQDIYGEEKFKERFL